MMALWGWLYGVGLRVEASKRTIGCEWACVRPVTGFGLMDG